MKNKKSLAVVEKTPVVKKSETKFFNVGNGSLLHAVLYSGTAYRSGTNVVIVLPFGNQSVGKVEAEFMAGKVVEDIAISQRNRPDYLKEVI